MYENYYSIDEVCAKLKITFKTVEAAVEKQILHPILIPFGSKTRKLFPYEEIDAISNLLEQTYGIKELFKLAQQDDRFSDITLNTLRNFIDRYPIPKFVNPIDSWDIRRILRSDLRGLFDYIDQKYRRRKYDSIKQWIKPGAEIKFISDVNGYLNFDFLRDCYINKYHAKGFSSFQDVARHTIYVAEYQNVDWFTNEKFDDIYIKCSDENKFLEFYELWDRVNNPEEYYTNKEVAQMFGRRVDTIAKFVNAIRVGKLLYLEKSKVDYIYKLEKETITLNELVEQLNLKTDHGDWSDKKIIRVLEKLGVEYIPPGKHPFGHANIIFQKDVPKIKKHFENELTLKTSSPYKKYKFLIQNIKHSHVPRTIEAYEDFVVERFNAVTNGIVLVNALVSIYTETFGTLKKEIFDYDNNELMNLLDTVDTNTAKDEMSRFLNFCNRTLSTRYTNQFKIHKGTNEEEVQPYSIEQWLDFGFLVFNIHHEHYPIYLEKALNVRGYAMTWLYCSLHYVVGWRHSDLLALPSLSLETVLSMNEYELIQSIREGKFSKEMAQLIINEMMRIVKAFQRKPQKTKRKSNQPLKVVVEDSYVPVIGMLIALCEAHRRIEKKKTLLTERAGRKNSHINFFSEPYREIFGEGHFMNSRAVKTYLNIVQTTSQDQGWGMGYYLASIIRSHKPDKRGIASTTQVYLEHINKSNDVDRITFALCERGTFGFLPYLMLKLIGGELFVKKDMLEQNEQISELLPIKPYMLEWLVKGVVDNQSRVAAVIKELLVTPKEAMMEMLRKISLGEAPSKMEHSQCLLKSVDRSKCIYPTRTDCVGCEYLIPEMYFLLQFRDLISQVLTNIETAVFEFDRQRFSYALLNAYLPILQEAVNLFGRERVSAFINLVEINSTFAA